MRRLVAVLLVLLLLPSLRAGAEPVEEVLNHMTLEEKVGQLFLGRCPGEYACEDVRTYHLGGYILFSQDFDGQTPDSLRAKIDSFQNAATIPLLIAVDEEGGDVCRVSNHAAFRATKFSSPRSLYERGGLDQVLGEEREKAWMLSGLGINVRFTLFTSCVCFIEKIMCRYGR